MEDTDAIWMREALECARKGIGKTAPNPAVGAVIVKNGQMISSGWHRGAGCPHAEIEALRALPTQTSAKGAEIFVTLEPCSTHGRTPPCTEAILQAGLKRVVFGATDPNPAHAGRAVKLLNEGGVKVRFGVLEQECSRLNQDWNQWIVSGIPWVVLKAGMSLDGRITAPMGERWITSPESRMDAMRLRAEAGAVLVGGNTVRMDNPQLTVRDKDGKTAERQPLRIVWTRAKTNLPEDCCLLADEFREKTRVVVAKNFREALSEVGKMGVVRVLVEGGSRVHGAAIGERLVNEVAIYLAPKVFGGGVPATGGKGFALFSESLRLKEVKHEVIGNDVKLTGLVINHSLAAGYQDVTTNCNHQ